MGLGGFEGRPRDGQHLFSATGQSPSSPTGSWFVCDGAYWAFVTKTGRGRIAEATDINEPAQPEFGRATSGLNGSLRLRSGQALRLPSCFASRSGYSACLGGGLLLARRGLRLVGPTSVLPTASAGVAGKVVSEREALPQRLKPSSEQFSYRSGKPLHPGTPKTCVLGTPALRHPKFRNCWHRL